MVQFLSSAAGGWSVAAVVIALLLTGQLLPRRFYKDMEQRLKDSAAELKDAKKERDTWMRAFFKIQEAHTQVLGQSDQLMGVAQTTQRVIEQLPTLTEKANDEVLSEAE